MSAKGMCGPMRTLRRLHNRIASNYGEPWFGEASETLSHVHVYIGTFSWIDSCRGVRKYLLEFGVVCTRLWCLGTKFRGPRLIRDVKFVTLRHASFPSRLSPSIFHTISDKNLRRGKAGYERRLDHSMHARNILTKKGFLSCFDAIDESPHGKLLA